MSPNGRHAFGGRGLVSIGFEFIAAAAESMAPNGVNDPVWHPAWLLSRSAGCHAFAASPDRPRPSRISRAAKACHPTWLLSGSAGERGRRRSGLVDFLDDDRGTVAKHFGNALHHFR